jgi:hypothetical protein
VGINSPVKISKEKDVQELHEKFKVKDGRAVLY